MPVEPQATLLVIEESSDADGEMTQTLQEAGYRLFSTSSVEAARQVMTEEEPDLIIIGPNISDTEGGAFAQSIKADPVVAHTPILFLSSAKEVATEHIADVVDAYLIAPLSPSVLRLNVRALLRLHAAEHTRQQTYRLLQAVQQSFPRWLAYLDRDLTFVQVNRAFSEAMGKQPEELIGKLYTEVISQQEVVAKRLRRAQQTGKATRLREIPYRSLTHRKRGPNRYLDVSFVPVLDEIGKVEGVILSAIDVTAEVQLRIEQAEEEKRQRELAEIANQEINHRIKNNLMTVAELLYFQAQSLREESAKTALQDAVSRLNVFARIHEQLQSIRTDEVDLLDLLQRVAAVSRSSLPDREVVVSVHGEAISLPTQAATNLALAANELITNGLRHGAPDTAGQIHIVVRLNHTTDQIAMVVWSSGNPVPADFDPSAQGGMGLHLVEAMVVRHYGGTFTMYPEKGGTAAQVIVNEQRLREV